MTRDPVDVAVLAGAVRPLRLVFWGAPFGLFAFPAWSPASFLVLALAALAGSLVLLLASSKLAAVRTGARHRGAMELAATLFGLCVFLALLILTLILVGRGRDAAAASFVPHLALCPVGMAFLCLGMRRLCDEADLVRASDRWLTAVYLAVIFGVVPAVGRLFLIDLEPWDPMATVAQCVVALPSLVAVVGVMHSTHYTIQTIMLLQKETQGRDEADGG